MARAGLQCLPVLHHRLNAERLHGAGEALVRGLLSTDNRDGEDLVAGVTVDVEHASHLFLRFIVRGVCRVALLPEELAGSQEDARTLNDWPALGLRYFAAPDERPDAWSGPEHTSFWEKADAAKLIVALNLGPNQAARLTPLVRDYPNIRWLLDHMARPRYDMDDAAYQPVLDLAGFPNVFVKISAWYAFTADVAEYPYDDLARFVVALRDAYGARRLLWGSDALPVLDFSSYTQTYTCLRHIPALSEDDLGWILGKTADSLFQPR